MNRQNLDPAVALEAKNLKLRMKSYENCVPFSDGSDTDQSGAVDYMDRKEASAMKTLHHGQLIHNGHVYKVSKKNSEERYLNNNQLLSLEEDDMSSRQETGGKSDKNVRRSKKRLDYEKWRASKLSFSDSTSSDGLTLEQPQTLMFPIPINSSDGTNVEAVSQNSNDNSNTSPGQIDVTPINYRLPSKYKIYSAQFRKNCKIYDSKINSTIENSSDSSSLTTVLGNCNSSQKGVKREKENVGKRTVVKKSARFSRHMVNSAVDSDVELEGYAINSSAANYDNDTVNANANNKNLKQGFQNNITDNYQGTTGEKIRCVGMNHKSSNSTIPSCTYAITGEARTQSVNTEDASANTIMTIQEVDDMIDKRQVIKVKKDQSYGVGHIISETEEEIRTPELYSTKNNDCNAVTRLKYEAETSTMQEVANTLEKSKLVGPQFKFDRNSTEIVLLAPPTGIKKTEIDHVTIRYSNPETDPSADARAYVDVVSIVVAVLAFKSKIITTNTYSIGIIALIAFLLGCFITGFGVFDFLSRFLKSFFEAKEKPSTIMDLLRALFSG